jgi:predicted restriction endonuclease
MSGRINEFDQETKKAAFERQGEVCAFCGISIGTPWQPGPVTGQAHHLRPILHGGDASLNNCVYLCHYDHKVIGHGMAPKGIDSQGGSSRHRVFLYPDDFPYWQNPRKK